LPLTPEGLTLLKTWEGCRLVAYPDPATGSAPWTIGYGHTGPEVMAGLTITQEEAEAWLMNDVAAAERSLERLLSGVALSARQRDALISFCFNVGAGALERSTLRRRLLASEAVGSVLAEELPRWCKGPSGPVEGLRNRRAAELLHASAEGTAPIHLLDAVQHHWDLPHQREAWRLLQASLSDAQIRAFAEKFRGDEEGVLQLDVPYLSQNDSVTGQGSRMCFASTCAMAAVFLQPQCLSGSGQRDDQYLALLQRYGDTTAAHAQVAALQGLGIQARFRRDGAMDDLLQQLKRGVPCPVGWLHKGHVSAPVGGGHWSLVIGWDPHTRELLMHDPNGEADLINGGYVSSAIESGQAQRYSERNWGKRWQVEGPGSGWWIEISR